MRRKIYSQLLDWKKNRKGDVALLIEGARPSRHNIIPIEAKSSSGYTTHSSLLLYFFFIFVFLHQCPCGVLSVDNALIKGEIEKSW